MVKNLPNNRGCFRYWIVYLLVVSNFDLNMRVESPHPQSEELRRLLQNLDAEFRKGFKQREAIGFGQTEQGVQLAFDTTSDLKKRSLEETILIGFPGMFLWGNIAECALDFRKYFGIMLRDSKSKAESSPANRVTLRSLTRRVHMLRVKAEDAIELFELIPQTEEHDKAQNRIRFYQRLERVVREASRLRKPSERERY